MIRTFAPLLSILFMAGAYGGYRYLHAGHVVEAATTSPAPFSEAIAYQARDIREQRALELLAAFGNDRPSADTFAFVVEWSLSEDRGAGAIERNNPWNTTQPGFNDTGCNMDDCVREYSTWEDGLAATVHTLMNGNYNEVVEGLRTNDPQRARNGLIASPWAASHYNGGIGWPVYTVQAAGVASSPISLAGDCGYNVIVALAANSGALGNVVLQPDQTFSFNATVGDPAHINYRTCAGVPAGNWCNLAARYAQVARSIGLTPMFEDHGVGDLGAGAENSVAIWNVDGQAGSAGESQDLEIRNTTDHIVTFHTEQQGDSVVIMGSQQ